MFKCVMAADKGPEGERKLSVKVDSIKAEGDAACIVI
jgi:hypothetical protein